VVILSQTLESLIKILNNDPTIRIDRMVDHNCMYIQTRRERYEEGRQYIKQICKWIDQGNYPTLSYTNVFSHYDCNTVKVCKREDESYQCLIDVIEDHHHQCKPFED
jgi:hypothetical protein